MAEKDTTTTDGSGPECPHCSVLHEFHQPPPEGYQEGFAAATNIAKGRQERRAERRRKADLLAFVIYALGAGAVIALSLTEDD